MYQDEYAATVERQLGDIYRLGAEASPTDPDPEVFDCSELVEWSYVRAGVKIPDGAWLQYDATVPVANGKPQVGDLVFLKNNPSRPNGIGHVGILTRVYYDSDRFIDARIVEAKGKDYGVVASTLSAWKKKSTFAGLRRHRPFDAAVKARPAEAYYAYLAHGLVTDLAHYKRAALEKGDVLFVKATDRGSWKKWAAQGYRQV